MICPNCKKETAPANCCMHCGAALNTTANSSKPKAPQSKGTVGKIFGIIALVVAVICIIANFIPTGATGTASYEKTAEDGSVSTLTYYYENDVVYKLVDSYTMQFEEGLTEEQAKLMEANLDLQYAGAKGLSNCIINYTHDDKSFTLTITSTGLNQVATLTALEKAKVVSTTADKEGELISYKISKNTLLSDGYTLVFETND